MLFSELFMCASFIHSAYGLGSKLTDLPRIRSSEIISKKWPPEWKCVRERVRERESKHNACAFGFPLL